MENGKVYIIPTTLGETNINNVIPIEVQQFIKKIKYFIVENIKTTRRYLKKIDKSINIDELTFFELNKHTDKRYIINFLEPTKKGNNIGVISEAGCPCIADPGSEIIKLAHQNNITVKPLVGPSSILLALISSGMNGQEFKFNGYLPFDKINKNKKIKEIEKLARKNITQIFMETPFRNDALLSDVLKQLSPDLKLCIATDISLETETIKTNTISNWKKNIPKLKKRPTIFVLGI